MHPKLENTGEVLMKNNIFGVQQQRKDEERAWRSRVKNCDPGPDDMFIEDWEEEEAAKRDRPLTRRLRKYLQTLLTDDQDVSLSFCPDLTRRISEEIARLSRHEPGGLASCRVVVIIETNNDYLSFNQENNGATAEKDPSLCLGTIAVSKKKVVETFEIRVHLFPSRSVLYRLHSIVTSLSLKRNDGKPSRPRSISLTPDFALVKRKLFRSSSNKPVIIKSSPK